MRKSTAKRKKSLIYSLVILLVLATIVSGYFFYYVPANTKTLQGNGFLILESISANIKDKLEGHHNFYRNIYSNAKDKKMMEALLKENNINATISYNNTQTKPLNSNKRNSATGQDEAISSGLRIENMHFIYTFHNSSHTDSVVFSESITSFLEPILKPQRKELFEAYALVLVKNIDSRIIYNDESIGIRSDINLDTLFPRSIKAYFSGIIDVNSEYYNHKIFYYPFQLDSFQLVLTGFIPAEVYSTKTRQVPFVFVYPLTIVFLLLLVFMPIIKFKVMDSNEQVKIIDIFLFALSAFFGVALLTLIIIQVLLWKGEEERVIENLDNLSSQIEQQFSQELYTAYDMLVALDKYRKSDSGKKGEEKTPVGRNQRICEIDK
jgi:hypothetical protein